MSLYAVLICRDSSWVSPGFCRRRLPVWLPKLVSFANVRMDDLSCRGAPRKTAEDSWRLVPVGIRLVSGCAYAGRNADSRERCR
jgi:hypothetical protein